MVEDKQTSPRSGVKKWYKIHGTRNMNHYEELYLSCPKHFCWDWFLAVFLGRSELPHSKQIFIPQDDHEEEDESSSDSNSEELVMK